MHGGQSPSEWDVVQLNIPRSGYHAIESIMRSLTRTSSGASLDEDKARDIGALLTGGDEATTTEFVRALGAAVEDWNRYVVAQGENGTGCGSADATVSHAAFRSC